MVIVIVIKKTYFARLLKLSINRNRATEKPTCKCTPTLFYHVMCFTQCDVIARVAGADLMILMLSCSVLFRLLVERRGSSSSRRFSSS